MKRVALDRLRRRALEAEDGDGGRGGGGFDGNGDPGGHSQSRVHARRRENGGVEGGRAGDLRSGGAAVVGGFEVRLTGVADAAAALAGAFAKFHAAFFLVSELQGSVRVGGADREEHEQGQQVLGDGPEGHAYICNTDSDGRKFSHSDFPDRYEPREK